jgi:nitrogen fixation NifU-like protein
MQELYRELILDHYRSPRGAAPLPRADRRAEGQNPLCGDECTVSLALDGERVGEIAFQARGCSISVASGSMMAGEIRGRTLAEVRALDAAVRGMLQGKGKAAGVDLGDLEALEGVSKFPVRVKCALLPWTTLAEALDRGDAGAAVAAPVTTEDGKGGR